MPLHGSEACCIGESTKLVEDADRFRTGTRVPTTGKYHEPIEMQDMAGEGLKGA